MYGQGQQCERRAIGEGEREFVGFKENKRRWDRILLGVEPDDSPACARRRPANQKIHAHSSAQTRAK